LNSRIVPQAPRRVGPPPLDLKSLPLRQKSAFALGGGLSLKRHLQALLLLQSFILWKSNSTNRSRRRRFFERLA
jgi:hypothetical protein